MAKGKRPTQLRLPRGSAGRASSSGSLVVRRESSGGPRRRGRVRKRSARRPPPPRNRPPAADIRRRAHRRGGVARRRRRPTASSRAGPSAPSGVGGLQRPAVGRGRRAGGDRGVQRLPVPALRGFPHQYVPGAPLAVRRPRALVLRKPLLHRAAPARAGRGDRRRVRRASGPLLGIRRSALQATDRAGLGHLHADRRAGWARSRRVRSVPRRSRDRCRDRRRSAGGGSPEIDGTPTFIRQRPEDGGRPAARRRSTRSIGPYFQ